MNKPLQKLTKEEVERMKKFYEYGPMIRRPIDQELARKGWLQPNDVVDGEVRAYEASDAAYRQGIPVLYDNAGVVKEHWLLETQDLEIDCRCSFPHPCCAASLTAAKGGFLFQSPLFTLPDPSALIGSPSSHYFPHSRGQGSPRELNSP